MQMKSRSPEIAARNPYISAQREWDERFAFHAATAKRFFWLAIAGTMVGCVGLGFGIWSATQSEYVPYLVKVDDLGRAEALPQPRTIGEWPTNVVKRELQRFVERGRSIPADPAILERNLRRLYRFLPTDSQAFRVLSDTYRNEETNPIVRWDRETVFVDVTSVSFAGGTTWRVEWTETVKDRSTGEQVAEDRFVGVLVLGQQAVTGGEALEINPLGLMIDSIDIQRVRSHAGD